MPSQATRPPLVGMPAVWLRDNSVLFHPDGHRAVSDRDWLAQHGEPAGGGPADPRTGNASGGERAKTGVIRRRDRT
jgi:hypothetical protein